MRSSFQSNNKHFRNFESLYIWKQLKENRGAGLPWYFAVSTNRMPAKYLISRSIPCKLMDLTGVNEQKLLEEKKTKRRHRYKTKETHKYVVG